MSLSIIGNFFFHIREKCFQGRDFAPEGWLYCSEQSEGCYRNPREQNPAQGHTSVWDRRKIIRTFFHFWCWMGLSFYLYRVLLTFECSKLWPRQPLQPLKPLLDFWNSALGKNLPYREEKSIFFIVMIFFPRGWKKLSKTGKEFGIQWKKVHFVPYFDF